MEQRIQGQLLAGKGMLAIAKALGCGTSTVQRVAREMQAGRPFERIPGEGKHHRSMVHVAGLDAESLLDDLGGLLAGHVHVTALSRSAAIERYGLQDAMRHDV
jgi:hypothetical protein